MTEPDPDVLWTRHKRGLREALWLTGQQLDQLIPGFRIQPPEKHVRVLAHGCEVGWSSPLFYHRRFFWGHLLAVATMSKDPFKNLDPVSFKLKGQTKELRSRDDDDLMELSYTCTTLKDLIEPRWCKTFVEAFKDDFFANLGPKAWTPSGIHG